MSEALDRLAESHGIQLAYISELGERVVIADEAKTRLLGVLGVDPQTGEPGVFDEALDQPTKACAMPKAVAGQRLWGVACQLYSLRSKRNLGIGDFADLAALAKIAGGQGASFVGVNPLHALFCADPGRFSPYSPSSRRFLNPLYLAIDELEGGLEAIDTLKSSQPKLFEGLDGDLVDYSSVGRLKMRLLNDIFAARSGEMRDEQAFERFRSEGGEALAGFALFEALSEAEVAAGRHAGWHNWPDALKDRGSVEVRRFADGNARRIAFHAWLQFEAEEQLAAAQAAAKTGAKGQGMAIGLYLDLAVGVAPDGAETWADPSLTVGAARVGSPPDMFNSQGQDWGLAPLSPKVLAERDYKPLREAFASLTRNAGAVRIDHAMGLARLWWIPEGSNSSGGAYMRYPLGAMIDTVADMSNANSCLVIGEDLGTVPPGFRHTMEGANILSYRVLYFERHGGTAFLPPSTYPEMALACVSTHDLATLAGWWQGSDIRLRQETGTQNTEATERDLAERKRDRRALIIALADEELLPEQYARAATGEDELPLQLGADLAAAVHRFVARTPSMLLTVQLDDMVGASEQPNLPGTTDQYPNWRVRSKISLEELTAHRQFLDTAAAMRQERPTRS